MFRRLPRSPSRRPLTLRKDSAAIFPSVQLPSIGFNKGLTIQRFACGIFPVPHLTIERRWLFPKEAARPEMPVIFAVWGRNLNFQKEKNRP